MKFVSFLVFKQLFLALLQLTILSTILIFSFGQYIDDINEQKSQIVRHFITHNITGDAKYLARKLQQNYHFHSLTIEQLDGLQLYKNINPPSHVSLSYQLLEKANWLPTTSELSNQPLNIKVSFSFSFQKQLNLLDSLLMSCVLVTALIALLNILLGKQILRLSFNRVSNLIGQLEEQFNHYDKTQPLEPYSNEGGKRFAPVIDALNQLQRSLVDKFSQAEQSTKQLVNEAYIDELTNLPNRTRFVENFRQCLSEADGLNYGSLAIIRCSQLNEINQSRGYQAGDDYIAAIVDIIKTCLGEQGLAKQSALFQSSQLYRLNGSDFAIIFPSTELKMTEKFATQLQIQFNQYQLNAKLDSVANTGLTRYVSGQAMGELLAMTDTAISIAQTKQNNSWHSQNAQELENNHFNCLGNQSWREVIEQVIETQSVELLVQPIAPCNRNHKAYSEILTRFINKDQQALPTTSFIAMAEKLEMINQVEAMIIDLAIQAIKSDPLTHQNYGINLTAKSAHDSQFLKQLEQKLKKEAELIPRLSFEISEHGLQQNLKASKRFISTMHKLGARVTVERFGTGLTSFKFFRELKPDNIKMDASYTRDIYEDKNNQYFLRQIIELAHRLDVNVFAETVETQEEKHTLEKLFIDGCQGFYIAKPQHL